MLLSLEEKGYFQGWLSGLSERKSWDLQVPKGYGLSSVMTITLWLKSQSSNPTSERSMNKKGKKLTYEWFARCQKTIISSHNNPTLVEECYTFSFHSKSLKVNQEAGRSRPRFGQGWFLLRPLSWVCWRPSAPCPHVVVPVCAYMSRSPLHIKTLVLWGQGPAQVTTFLASPAL